MRKSMPSKSKIKKYWLKKDPYLVLRHENDISEFWCFCCGRTTGIERAHILPNCNGGDENVKNLHLLCSSCHFKTEGLYLKLGSDFYYHYLKTHKNWILEFEINIYKFYKKTYETNLDT